MLQTDDSVNLHPQTSFIAVLLRSLSINNAPLAYGLCNMHTMQAVKRPAAAEGQSFHRKTVSLVAGAQCTHTRV